MSSKNARIIRQRRRGGAMLELAITMALLLNLTFGLVEFGYYFYVKNSLAMAALVGARTAIIQGSTNATTTSAANSALAGCKFPSGSCTVSITDTSGNALTLSNVTAGTNVQVTVSANWGTIGNGFRPLALIGSGKSVSGYCVLVHE